MGVRNPLVAGWLLGDFGNLKNISKTTTAKFYRQWNPSDPTKTKSDDDDSCAARSSMYMKKIIAARCNLH